MYSYPLGEREEEVAACASTLFRDCLLGEGVQGDQSRVGKRKRTGAPQGLLRKVHQKFGCTSLRFTPQIQTVYAVCHSCDRGYKVRSKSKNGTSQFIRHNKSCSSKRPKV